MDRPAVAVAASRPRLNAVLQLHVRAAFSQGWLAASAERQAYLAAYIHNHKNASMCKDRKGSLMNYKQATTWTPLRLSMG